MKKFIFPSILPLLLAMFIIFPSCSDNEPPEASENDILGIWQDKPGHILDMVDADHLYDYTLTEYEGTQYWIRKKQMYFFEPRSGLMLKEGIAADDGEVAMHVYKIIDVNDDELVICWVSTPDLSNLEGENKLEIFKIFFDKDYEVDPELYETFRRLSPEELKKVLGDIEILGD